MLFTLYLFRMERNRVPRMSRELWIPLIWHFIVATRSVSTWFNPDAAASPESYLEGSPVDRAIFLALILAAMAVLIGRSASLTKIVASNPWLVLFLVYCGISTVWSDYSFVAFKRWIKEIGNVLMVLIVLTEKDPVAAAMAMLRRIVYVAVPLSIVLIKYFGDIGRQFTHSGELMFVGATTHKNSLGILCGILLIAFLWHLLHNKRPVTRWERSDRRIHLLLVLMMIWLMYLANSATSAMCAIVGIAVLVGMELPVMQRNYRHIGVVVVCLLVIGFLLEYSFDLWQVILTGLGRDATLTGRTVLMGAGPCHGHQPGGRNGLRQFLAGTAGGAVLEHVPLEAEPGPQRVPRDLSQSGLDRGPAADGVHRFGVPEDRGKDGAARSLSDPAPVPLRRCTAVEPDGGVFQGAGRGMVHFPARCGRISPPGAPAVSGEHANDGAGGCLELKNGSTISI